MGQELAQIGIHANRVTVARYEAGTRIPSELTWQGLAEFFNTSVPFVRGYGIRIENAKEQVMGLLINTYYSKIPRSPNYLKKCINQFLLLQGTKKTADTFIDPEKHVVIEAPYVGVFWKNEFDFLFMDQFIRSIDGLSEAGLANKMYEEIGSRNEKLISLRNDAWFIEKYDQVDAKIREAFFTSNKENLLVAIEDAISFLRKAEKTFKHIN